MKFEVGKIYNHPFLKNLKVYVSSIDELTSDYTILSVYYSFHDSFHNIIDADNLKINKEEERYWK